MNTRTRVRPMPSVPILKHRYYLKAVDDGSKIVGGWCQCRRSTCGGTSTRCSSIRYGRSGRAHWLVGRMIDVVRCDETILGVKTDRPHPAGILWFAVFAKRYISHNLYRATTLTCSCWYGVTSIIPHWYAPVKTHTCGRNSYHCPERSH